MALQNDKAILFHSLTGKDSSVLLDLMHPYFKKIYCVYMYWVKDLELTKPYERQCLNYGNTEIIQVPYPDNALLKKSGIYHTAKMNFNANKLKYRDYEDYFTRKLETNVVAWGMKRDTFHRIGMFNKAYKSEIHQDYDKFYPIVAWRNTDCLTYIKKKKLLKPLNFGLKSKSSSICESPIILSYIKENYPKDYTKIVAEYPLLSVYTDNYNYNKKYETD